MAQLTSTILREFHVGSIPPNEVQTKITAGADGRGPGAGLVFDSAGNLYGTTAFGGPLTIAPATKITLNHVFPIGRLDFHPHLLPVPLHYTYQGLSKQLTTGISDQVWRLEELVGLLGSTTLEMAA